MNTTKLRKISTYAPTPEEIRIVNSVMAEYEKSGLEVTPTQAIRRLLSAGIYLYVNHGLGKLPKYERSK